MKNPSYNDIESDWKMTKLLLSSVESRMLAFNLGQCDIFLENLISLRTSPQRDESMVLPFIATVRSKSIQEPLNFIRRFPEYRGHKIFKFGRGFHSDSECYGLIANTVKNMLGLRKGKIFYISSNNSKLRQLFYNKAVEFNEENHFGCSFDFEIYDYKLTIKKYDIAECDKCDRLPSYSIVSYLEGHDMPNSWNSPVEGDKEG